VNDTKVSTRGDIADESHVRIIHRQSFYLPFRQNILSTDLTTIFSRN